jgi:(E)-4-hydroxy-3-methylbut-2-enyl-diphosphate synthase
MTTFTDPQKTSANKYCDSLTSYSRRKTRTVNIGDVPMGSDFPIRIQSMTTTDTMNTLATVEQSIRMVNAGCEYVRITAPSMNEAQNLAEIKKELRRRGYNVPLVADIHFTPNAAELAARIVEKVRVNPGNYADKKKFEHLQYTDSTYEEELDRIRSRFTPLVKICKEYGTAMRIGTNHGSLSDRIMSRYGDTPTGMVESAMEFLRICEDEKYYNIVLSMKASNPQVMVQAYRLLVNRMDSSGMDYPLHLGVTEAGEGEDGRIKSAVGIGSLLEDGIGDTVRVSLTEDPEFEAPVAIALVERYKDRSFHLPINAEVDFTERDPFVYEKRKSHEVANIGGSNVPRVMADVRGRGVITEFELKQLGHIYDASLDKWHMTDLGCDYLFMGDDKPDFMLPNGLRAVYEHKEWLLTNSKENSYPLFSKAGIFDNSEKHPELNFLELSLPEMDENIKDYLRNNQNTVIFLTTANTHGMAEQRAFFMEMKKSGLTHPVILNRSYEGREDEKVLLHSSTDMGSLLLDGFGDGICITAANTSLSLLNSVSFGILQATRTRISKTEYISCPSCGRTLFDLQETTARIRKVTDHLKGVKIGIMGCIVNGPGEMADADYGYVGTGPGRITLYRGKEVVKRNVVEEQAVDELIRLIKEDNRWLRKK